MAQLKDLIVSGPSRLIGPVYGKITNAYSADTAASAPWAGITGKPTIPAAANNATITLSGHGINKSFTVNQSSNATLDLSHTHVAANITGGTNGYFLKADSAGKGVWQSVTIPTVNNGTLTIQKNGSNVGTFTANQSTDATINITETQLSKGTTSTGTTAAKAAVADISVSNHQITLTTTPKIYSASTADNATYASYLGTSSANYTKATLDTALNGKSNTGHTHAAGDITSGTLALARIPTGTTSSTVSRGDHTHAYSPTNHASTATTYGLGTTSSYGHVKMQEGDVSWTTATTNGVACSPNHLHVYLKANGDDRGIGSVASDYDNKFRIHTKRAGDISLSQDSIATGDSLTVIGLNSWTISSAGDYPHEFAFHKNQGKFYHRIANGPVAASWTPWKRILEDGDVVSSPWEEGDEFGAYLGLDVAADGGNSVAFGYNANAYGSGSMAFGDNDASDVEFTKLAEGSGSLAHGYTYGGDDCIWAAGNGSTAFGTIVYEANPSYNSQIYAAGEGALAYGCINSRESGIKALGAGSTACGYVTNSNDIIHAYGDGSYAGGYTSGASIEATRPGAHAEGFAETNHGISANGSGAHAEGYGTTANGNYSHAEGSDTVASGASSHAEGASSQASGEGSHAEGYITTANGNYSHAGGHSSTANTQYGFAHGLGVIDYASQAESARVAFGKYNQTGMTTIFSIGNGTSNTARSNAFHVNNDGKAYTPNGFYETSDERKKDFHGDVKVDFKDIDNIPTKYFTWKEGEDMAMKIGTSAQEIEKIYPEVVDYDKEKDAYTVDYGRLSIVALAAVKELHKENETLKSEIELLKERLDRFENK